MPHHERFNSVLFSTLLIDNTYGNQEPTGKVEISAVVVGLVDSYA
jgi:hypothetical protein